MSGIFISYRRDDTRGTTGRLYDVLTDHFGREAVFRDLDAIQPGAIFGQTIEAAIAGSQAVVVVIGAGWLRADAAGRRRIDDQADLVRREVASALAQDKVVVPVLVEDAAMPAETDLPADLAPLARRNALSLSDQRWDYDTSRLVRLLEPLLGTARAATGDTRSAPRVIWTAARGPASRLRRVPRILGPALLGALVLAAVLISRDDGDGGGRGATTTTASVVVSPTVATATSQPAGTVPPGAISIAIGDTVGNGKPSGAGNVAAPGAKQVFSFSAAAGQIVFLKELYEGDGYELGWKLRSPSGSEIVDKYMKSDIGRVRLAADGAYAIEVYSVERGTGLYGFQLIGVPPDAAFPIPIGATVGTGRPQGAGNITTPGAKHRFTFEAKAGQVVFLKQLYEGPSHELGWKLVAPSGTEIVDKYIQTDIGRVELTADGTYAIEVYSQDRGTGTYGFELAAVP
jgi:hypothetical protein